MCAYNFQIRVMIKFFQNSPQYLIHFIHTYIKYVLWLNCMCSTFLCTYVYVLIYTHIPLSANGICIIHSLIKLNYRCNFFFFCLHIQSEHFGNFPKLGYHCTKALVLISNNLWFHLLKCIMKISPLTR